MLDYINVVLDPQWIVSQEDFQHIILDWSSLLPFCPCIQLGQERGGGDKNYEDYL